MNNSLSGIVNIYKEKGMTSFDVVSAVRKTARVKTGHCGTLDPDAEGVLPVCLGKATKLADYIMNGDKTYIAGVKLGIETDTQDASGKITATGPVSASEDGIRRVLESFKPSYMQVPPMYSAIKIGGQKLYEMARKGREIERQPREVVIAGIELLGYDGKDSLSIEVNCGKGTYIRALAADIGQRLGCGAHMSSLLRTKSGPFALESAVRLSEFGKAAAEGRLADIILGIDEALWGFTRYTAREEADFRLVNGAAVSAADINQSGQLPRLAVISRANGQTVGIYELWDSVYKPRTMLL